MREADRLEVKCSGRSPHEILELALENDDLTLTALDAQDVPFAMFGVGKTEKAAYIWLLGTDAVVDNKYDFIKASRHYVNILTQPYTTTFNFVHRDNKLAISWLQFCGAKFIRMLTIGNEPFFEFIIITN
jgi:hypothetical protein